jgi:hypothetical protein
MFAVGLLLTNYAGSANSKDPWNLKVPVGDFDPPRPNKTGIIDEGPTVHRFMPWPHSYWTGAYEPISRESGHVKKLVITEGGAGMLRVQVWMALDQVEGTPTFSAAPLETRAAVFRDADKKTIDDTLVADFKDAQFQPIIVITRGTPILPGNLQKYQYITYTCYLSGYRGNCYIRGRLDRRDENKHD